MKKEELKVGQRIWVDYYDWRKAVIVGVKGEKILFKCNLGIHGLLDRGWLPRKSIFNPK